MTLLALVGWAASITALALLRPTAHPFAAGLAYAAGFGCLALFVRARSAQGPEAGKRDLWLVLGLGLAARLLLLAAHEPGSDLARCVWEGLIQTRGFNPYALAPDHPALAELARGPGTEVFGRINHPGLAAIYPPVAQLLFRATAWLQPTETAFRLLLLAAELGAGLALIPILKRRELSPSRLSLYWLNPLVLSFLSAGGHVDALAVCFLALALLAAPARAGLSFFLFGCAALCKYTVLPALPFLVTARNRRASFFALVPLLAFLPYLDAGKGLFESLLLFGRSMWYNDSLMVPLRLVLGPWASMAACVLLALFLAAALLLARDREHGAFLSCGATLLLLPSLHPWYLGVVALFLPLFPSGAWLWLQAAMALTFGTLAWEAATGAFVENAWLRLPEYLPFFALLLWEARHGHVLARARRYAPVATLSVLVPTLNEERTIAACLGSLGLSGTRPEEKRTEGGDAAPGDRAHFPPVPAGPGFPDPDGPGQGLSGVLEVIVADGGSSDATRELARALGARVVETRPGRGGQIAEAARLARGDALLVLHADCRLDPGTPARILQALNGRPDSPGGCLGMRFARGPGRSRLIEGLNAFRASWLHLPFGDQGQFVRREALADLGGFPEQALMEDLELALRLKDLGTPLYLGQGVTASARRWSGPGFGSKAALVLRLCGRYLLERRLGLADPGGMRYYARYYRNSPNPRGRT